MKKILIFVVLALLISCGEDKSAEISFSTSEFSAEDFETCKDNKCPEIEIDYLVAEGKQQISAKINKNLEKIQIGFLANDPDHPIPSSFKEALENFIADYQDFRADYPKFPAGYEVRITEEIAYLSEEIIVIKTKHYLFTGGAHGYQAINFSTFSLETGQLLKPKDLFRDVSGFTNYAEKKFREKYEIPANDSINSTGLFFENDKFSLPKNIAILENEVVLIYNPYEAAAYAQGEMLLRFSKSDVKQWLKYE